MKGNDCIVIHGWMRTDLGLKGNELMVFAMIHSFSQKGGCGCYASLKHYMDWTGASRQTVVNTLKSLEDKKLIRKSGKSTSSTNIYISAVKVDVFVKQKSQKERKPQKTKNETAEPDGDVQKALDLWKKNADRLKEEGKISAIVTDGLENARSKLKYNIGRYGAPKVMEMLDKASEDAFCVDKAGYSLPVLMNNTVFHQTLNKAIKVQTYETMKPRKSVEELAAALGITREKYLEDLADGKIYNGRYLSFS